MDSLQKPSKELAKRVLSEVGFEDRLTGYRLNQRLGAVDIPLYSVEEILILLNDDLPYINIEKLESWTRNVAQDHELAQGINTISKQDAPDLEKLAKIGTLMEKRYIQCENVMSNLDIA
jgi:hypothetical protein